MVVDHEQHVEAGRGYIPTRRRFGFNGSGFARADGEFYVSLSGIGVVGHRDRRDQRDRIDIGGLRGLDHKKRCRKLRRAVRSR